MLDDHRESLRERMLQAASKAHDDARGVAPGLREYDTQTQWSEGNGRAPLGWVPWDYEQAQGYRAFLIGHGESPWLRDDRWDFDEVGVHPWDLSDEMEDWDLGPYRKRYNHDEDLDCHSTLPEIDPEDWVKPKDDALAREYEERHEMSAIARSRGQARVEAAQRAREHRRKAAEAEAEAEAHVKEVRRNQVVLREAARKYILSKVEEGVEESFEVRIRKGNQTYRVDFSIRDGKAVVTKRRHGWVSREARR